MKWNEKWNDVTLVINTKWMGHDTTGNTRTLTAYDVDEIIGSLYECDNGDYDRQHKLILMFKHLLDEAVK